MQGDIVTQCAVEHFHDSAMASVCVEGKTDCTDLIVSFVYPSEIPMYSHDVLGLITERWRYSYLTQALCIASTDTRCISSAWHARMNIFSRTHLEPVTGSSSIERRKYARTFVCLIDGLQNTTCYV